MPRLFTKAQLIERCQKRVSMENGGAVNDADEFAELLSTQYAELYGLVVESGHRYFETSAIVVTDGVDNLFALPQNHLSTIGVDFLIAGTSSGPRRRLREWMVQERNIASGITGPAQGYSLAGQNLALFPRPPSGQSYEHIYIPQPDDLTAYDDEDEIDVVTPDGEAFLIWGVAVQALAKEESDTSVAERREAQARERVIDWAIKRALNEHRRLIVDDDCGYVDPAEWWPR